MGEAPKYGRAKSAPERFEAFESDPTAHLTGAQKQWTPAKLRPATERLTVLTRPPELTLKLHFRSPPSGPDAVTLAADVFAILQALSEAERQFGGGGLALVGQRIDSDAVVLTVRHSVAEGAGDRGRRLADLLNGPHVEPAEVPVLLEHAAQSPAGRVNLLLSGSRTVLRCEVLIAAA